MGRCKADDGPDVDEREREEDMAGKPGKADAERAIMFNVANPRVMLSIITPSMGSKILTTGSATANAVGSQIRVWKYSGAFKTSVPSELALKAIGAVASVRPKNCRVVSWKNETRTQI